MKASTEHVDEPKGKKVTMKTINSKVFDSFNQLTNEQKVKRINGAVGLLQHLSHNQQQNEENKVNERPVFVSDVLRLFRRFDKSGK